MTPPTPPEPATDLESPLMRALNAIFPLELQSITEVYELVRVRNRYRNHGGNGDELIQAHKEALHAIAIRQKGKATVVPVPPHGAEIRMVWATDKWSWIDDTCGGHLWDRATPAPDNIRDIARAILAADASSNLHNPEHRRLSEEIHAALEEFRFFNPGGVLTSAPAHMDTRSREELLVEIARLQAEVAWLKELAKD